MTNLQTSPEFVDAMQIQTIDLDGQLLRVAVRRGSDASPPLLLFNGIGANLELVEPFVAALDDVTVIVFDVPGVGGSPAPLLPYRFSTLAVLADKLLTRLGYTDPVDVLGVSWGGALAQQFAHLYPKRCRRLILAATSPGVIMVPARLSVLSKLVGPRRYTDPSYLKQIGAEIYGGAYRHDAALLEEHSRHIQAPRGRGYLYQLLAASGWTSLPWLGGLRQTTLVMHGNDDPIVPLANAKILAARIRNATLQVIDDGHLFLITRAREVAPAIKRFLRQEAS
ncbi:poly(3-hydroxyalkanoate) depolymerase [Paraburkholderia phenazinium]|uniref:Poly(3-hydroxyalkanoate) depolymerase n=1 Tax=Paraburkholderia phenazinium TaxID=60549 RepID=A0A1N6GAZ0_9BURK|nr:poly(3-hydroxyalkanoate) depolymerase [Paraburkholderia phenazinium]SIO04602.1 poly(3-hydroxyalkanoate) depolymerase [Paraburkholderia phenazinium]